MVDLKELLGLSGITLILTSSTLLTSVRLWILSKSETFGELVQCPMCLGFWVGLSFSFIKNPGISLSHVITAGSVSLSSYFIDAVLKHFEKEN
jgi:hypothetical protein